MTNTKSLSYFYVSFGFACGFLLCATLTKEVATVASRLLLALMVLALIVFGRKLEATVHDIHVQNWSLIRARGKWHFIITRYILMRALVLFTLFIAPLLKEVNVSSVILSMAMGMVVLLASILGYFGLDEWNNCERDFAIQLLKNAGEQVRIAQN